MTDFIHPLLESWYRSERNDEDTRLEFRKFILARAQLCGMFTAGNSAKVTEEDEQGVSAFENFAKCDLFAVEGLQGEVGGGRVGFESHVFQCQVKRILPKGGVE